MQGDGINNLSVSGDIVDNGSVWFALNGSDGTYSGNISGDGNVFVSSDAGGTLTFGGTITCDAFTVSGAPLVVLADAVVSVESLENNGTLDVGDDGSSSGSAGYSVLSTSDLLDNAGTVDIANGSLTSCGALNNSNTGTINITCNGSSIYSDLDNEGTLYNFGIIETACGESSYCGTAELDNGGTLANYNQIYVAYGGSPWYGATMVNYAAVTNDGMINVQSGGFLLINDPSATLTNEHGGSLYVESGGSFYVASGSLVNAAAPNNGTVEVNGGGLLQVGPGTINGTVAGDIDNEGSVVFYLTSSGETCSANFSGSGSLTLWPCEGNPTLTLSGDNSGLAGQTFVDGGMLEALSPAALPGFGSWSGVSVGSTLAVAAGGAGEWQAADIATLLDNASFGYCAVLGINVASGSFLYPSSITDSNSGSMGIAKLGCGTLVFDGSNSYSGGTTVYAGTLEAETTAALGGDANFGNLTVDTGATLAVAVGGAGEWNSAAHRRHRRAARKCDIQYRRVAGHRHHRRPERLQLQPSNRRRQRRLFGPGETRSRHADPRRVQHLQRRHVG